MVILEAPSALMPANDNLLLSGAQERLSRALDGLVAALDRQAEALRGFRDNCQKLERSVTTCGDGLRRYQAALETIDTEGLRRSGDSLLALTESWPEMAESDSR
ncbi:hypothetical protein [Rhodospirillum rubrum]|uniref:Uncharacterized protein n=1 Tax=Rhodospirillum rubrum (strain ATCC 11170 / ATH 1.1.1 / DSM 467 / LMG 4362 / NCIMB 8255 / S1) TaxID=269796 RepID=Q2RPD2_RHORT|nr:hypothetical protein [Rhodospirillum rubrum]ABC24013.1 hypothetical protein Rru_A3218 [Rhodospirillum rubrum ATCC 11170]AEO49758.1 hypothetical protein F11_16480 [Rhodospirillum rubrum F11]MBK5955697.1 hypothetical protein [Rhodospirillum rubrum]QXG79956.1 hypothetical protein KUL73_16585 [Rhodospirillum rubrum]HCF19509.1 hypothetical protein [Rhodospirillum rubrum]